MKYFFFIVFLTSNVYVLNGQGVISFSYASYNTNGKEYVMKGSEFRYDNVEELLKILNNPPDTIEQIIIEDDHIKKLPSEFFKLNQTRSIQIISKSITAIDKKFIRMDSLEVIECIFDSIGFVSPKLYKLEKLWNVNVDANRYNSALKNKLPLLVQKFDMRKRYFVIKAGDLFFETKTLDTLGN